MLEELNKKTEQAERERNGRYQLFEIRNDLEEIRNISERTCEYAGEIYPSIAGIPEWSIIPRIVMEFITATFQFLKTKRKKGMSETFVELPNFVHFGIEFGTTEDAEKDATFNPIITVMGELTYDNEHPENNVIPKAAPEMDFDTNIQFISETANNVLKGKYGIIIEDWKSIPYIFIAFSRVAKEYLVNHKDDKGDFLTINLGNVMDMVIEKYDGESGESYDIGFGPGKTLKMDYAKSDEESENND